MLANFTDRFFCAAGGLFGASGIAAYAAAMHIGGYYNAIAPILFGNAAVLLILAFYPQKSIFNLISGTSIIVGALLFSSDLLMRTYVHHHFFPYATPLGGITMIWGWLFFTIVALMPPRK